MAPSAVVFLALALLAPGTSPTAAPASGPDTAEPVFASASLRIYRVVDSTGQPHLVLTNLDAEGNRLAAEEMFASTPPLPVEASAWEQENSRAEAEAPGEPTSGQREIHVDAGDDNVVRVDDGTGTTIIININSPPPPAPAEQEIVPVAAVPWVGWGTVVGGYEYPDELPFLGYSTGVGSPSWLGGLGLNAGNGYGLSTGKSCRRGFDCMFPPTAPSP